MGARARCCGLTPRVNPQPNTQGESADSTEGIACGESGLDWTVIATVRPPAALSVYNGVAVAARQPSSVCQLLRREAASLPLCVDWVSPVRPDVASALSEHDPVPASAGLGRGKFVPVAVDDATFSAAYRLATRHLWFAYHDIPAHLGSPARDEARPPYAAFRHMNAAVAVGICANQRPEVPVIVNDYQLSLAPQFVRERCPGRPIAFMSYTAFATLARWRQLPTVWRRSVLRGMLGADLIGFVSHRWADRFAAAVVADGCGSFDAGSRSISHAGGRSALAVYPVHVSSAELASVLASSEATGWAAAMRSDSDVGLIARTDRLDPAKNIAVGFEAFATLLDRSPRWRGRARFAACLSPSRTDIVEYQACRDEVFRLIDKINRQHPSAVTLYTGENRVRALALLSVADVTLVNSLADGMNLVAQEAASVGSRDGALVLSATTGSAELLGDAAILIHNPRDVSETARALGEALDFTDEERAVRAARLATLVNVPYEPLVPRLLRDLRSRLKPSGVPC
jgi:trehalose 6-phosphate synthase